MGRSPMGFEVHVHCCEGQKSHEQLGGMSSDVLILSARERTTMSLLLFFNLFVRPVTLMLYRSSAYGSISERRLSYRPLMVRNS